MSKVTMTQQASDMPNPAAGQQSWYAKEDETWARNPTGNPLQISNRPVRFFYHADQFDNPNNADWKINALAPSASDSVNNALTVRLFDDTTEEAVGDQPIPVPAKTSQLKLSTVSGAKTAPAGARTVGVKLYWREIIDNAAVGAWDSGTQLTDVDIPTNAFWQFDSVTVSFSTLGIAAGKTYQFSLSRVAPSGGTNLTGDWKLLQAWFEFLP